MAERSDAPLADDSGATPNDMPTGMPQGGDEIEGSRSAPTREPTPTARARPRAATTPSRASRPRASRPRRLHALTARADRQRRAARRPRDAPVGLRGRAAIARRLPPSSPPVSASAPVARRCSSRSASRRAVRCRQRRQRRRRSGRRAHAHPPRTRFARSVSAVASDDDGRAESVAARRLQRADRRPLGRRRRATPVPRATQLGCALELRRCSRSQGVAAAGSASASARPARRAAASSAGRRADDRGRRTRANVVERRSRRRSPPVACRSDARLTDGARPRRDPLRPTRRSSARRRAARRRGRRACGPPPRRRARGRPRAARRSSPGRSRRRARPSGSAAGGARYERTDEALVNVT